MYVYVICVCGMFLCGMYIVCECGMYVGGVSVYVVFVWVYMVYVYVACACICVGLWVCLPQSLSTLYFEAKTLIELGFTVGLNWLANNFQGSLCLSPRPPPQHQDSNECCCVRLYVGVGCQTTN